MECFLVQTSAHPGQVLVVGAVLFAVVAADAGVGVMVVFIAVGVPSLCPQSVPVLLLPID